VNEPTTFPLANKSHGSHHWTFERLLAAGLVPLTGAAFVTSGSFTPLLDGLLGISLIVHSHIGVRFFSYHTPSFINLSSSAGGNSV
jgi:succinate dehydrogenase (ubiquinone) membrane anchor subunit